MQFLTWQSGLCLVLGAPAQESSTTSQSAQPQPVHIQGGKLRMLLRGHVCRPKMLDLSQRLRYLGLHAVQPTQTCAWYVLEVWPLDSTKLSLACSASSREQEPTAMAS